MAFDIRNIVAELPSEADSIDFTFDLKLAHEVKVLRRAEDLDEELLAAKEAELAAASYTAHLVSVPRGRRQEIYNESLVKFKAPVLTGRPDEDTQFKRNNFVRVGVIAAAIVKLVDPNGEEQTEDIFESIQFIHDKAPDQIFERIENKVNELNMAEDEQDALNHSADF